MDSNNEITHRAYYGAQNVDVYPGDIDWAKMYIKDFSQFKNPFSHDSDTAGELKFVCGMHEESGPLPCETKLKFIIEKHKQFKHETEN